MVTDDPTGELDTQPVTAAEIDELLRPTVSVVIPIKGRATYFARTVDSLVGQTYPDWEAVVVDDGSTSEEYAGIAALVKVDERFRLLRNPGPRQGASPSRNAGFRASRGEWVVFLDADDLLAPGCLERRVQVMRDDPTLDFAVFLTRIFHHEPGDSPYFWNLFNGKPDLERFLRQDNPWHTSGPIWRRSAVERIGLWDDRARSWQDWEFHVRALAAGLRYARIEEADSYWRFSTRGSISQSSHTPAFAVNRARVIRRVARYLEAEGKLTPAVRRLLAAQLLTTAFRTRQTHRRALRIWRAARAQHLIGAAEYRFVAACEGAADAATRLCWKLERRAFREIYAVQGARWKMPR